MHTYIHTFLHTYIHTYIHAYIHTVPVIKKLKYSTAGILNGCARGSLEVRSWCGTHAQICAVRCGAVRCARAAIISGCHAHRIRVPTAVENYPLLRVVGEDHLDHDQISHLGHVNTRCAKIRSQYRIAPRRLALYSASVQGAARVAYRAHRTARTAPHRVHVYMTVEVRSTFGVNSVLIRYCFGTASVR